MTVDLRQSAATISDNLRENPLRQISETVGELGIRSIHNGLRTVTAVLADGELAQAEIAQSIDTEAIGQDHRIDDVANALRHLFAAAQQEAMAVDLLGKRDPRRHQERRPVDGMETYDILADQ